MKKSDLKINLDVLQEGLPAISRAIGIYLAEGAAYCLESNGHKSGVRIKINNGDNQKAILYWLSVVDEQTQRSWNDTQEATEYGATAIALVLLKCLTKYTVIERSFKGTGFDYWLGTGEYDENLLPFEQRKARLEISGIWKESKGNTIKKRMKLKKKQVANVNYADVPIVIIVVEFGTPKAKLFGI